jgi:hypothetical protein
MLPIFVLNEMMSFGVQFANSVEGIVFVLDTPPRFDFF